MVTGADLQGRVAPFTRHAITTSPHVADAIGLVVKSHRAEVLPTSVVLRVGEPVAVVVAKDRYQAEDAAELVDVQYDSLPVVTDPSPLNPLGVKGVGEGGTTSAPAALANATVDVMKPLDLDIDAVSLVPARLK